MPLLPYRNLSELPARVQRHLPLEAQDIYLKAYNKVIDNVLLHGRWGGSSSGESTSSSSTTVFPTYSTHNLREPHSISEYNKEEAIIKANCHRNAWKAVKEHFDAVKPIINQQSTGLLTSENTTPNISESDSTENASVTVSGTSSRQSLKHLPKIWIKKFEDSDTEINDNNNLPLTSTGGNI